MKITGSNPVSAILLIAGLIAFLIALLYWGCDTGALPGTFEHYTKPPINVHQACICSPRHACDACAADTGCLCPPQDVDLIPPDAPVTIEGPCPCVGGFCDPFACKMADGGCGCSFLDSYLAKKRAEAFAKKMLDEMNLRMPGFDQ